MSNFEVTIRHILQEYIINNSGWTKLNVLLPVLKSGLMTSSYPYKETTDFTNECTFFLILDKTQCKMLFLEIWVNIPLPNFRSWDDSDTLERNARRRVTQIFGNRFTLSIIKLHGTLTINVAWKQVYFRVAFTCLQRLSTSSAVEGFSFTPSLLPLSRRVAEAEKFWAWFSGNRTALGILPADFH